MSRADKGALLLADVIEQRLYGRRPLTLIGVLTLTILYIY